MVKRDPKPKGATSIDNLPPPGVLNEKAGTKNQGMFIFGSGNNSLNMSPIDLSHTIAAIGNVEEAQIVANTLGGEQISSNIKIELLHCEEATPKDQQQQLSNTGAEMVIDESIDNINQAQLADAVMIGAKMNTNEG
ncbi:hypothetical protein SLA2020_013980 [Shorea laevis]